MWGFQYPPLDHCEFHGSKFQVEVEAQPVGSQELGEALALEGKVELSAMVVDP